MAKDATKSRRWRVETAEVTLVVEAPSEAIAREKALDVLGDEGDVCYALFIEPLAEPVGAEPPAEAGQAEKR